MTSTAQIPTIHPLIIPESRDRSLVSRVVVIRRGLMILKKGTCRIMEAFSSLVGIGLFLVIGTVAANFLFHTLRPDWHRKKHILYCSMAPAFGLWLLVTVVLTISILPESGFVFEYIVPIIVLAILLPFLGALIGIPTTWLILKQTNWNKSTSLNDIFE